jgi:hypothetical protein
MGTPRIDRLEENIFINGGMRIAQRGGNSVLAITGTYTVLDRWIVTSSGVTLPFTRRTGPFGNSSQFISNFTHGMNGTINSSTDTLSMTQRVEASRLRAIMAGESKLSGSITLAPSVDTDIRIAISYPTGGENNYSGFTLIYDQTFAVSGHTVVKFEDIDLPDIALDNGIQVLFSVTNWSATGGQFVDISDAMLNPGRVVAQFNEREPGEEQRLCDRYFQRYADNTALGGGHAGTVSSCFCAFIFRNVMRTNPTASTGGATYPIRVQRGTGSRDYQLASGVFRPEGANMTLFNPDVADLSPGSGLTMSINGSAYLDFDAEL